MEKFNYKPTKPKDASTLIIIKKNLIIIVILNIVTSLVY